MDRKKLEGFILDNKEKILVNDQIDQYKVLEIEKTLNVKLPDDYIWFLQKYGFIMGFGVEVFGITKADDPTVVRETLRFRRMGLPKNFIVIQNCDEWVNCLNTLKVPNQEHSIFTWDVATQNNRFKANDFLNYLFQTLNEGKELWEEDF